MRDSFLFYKSFIEVIKNADADDFKKSVLALCEYALDDKAYDGDGYAQMFYKYCKPKIDRNNAWYENGKKGGRPKKNENPTITQSKPKHNPSITQAKPNNNPTITQSKPNHNPIETQLQESPLDNISNLENISNNTNNNLFTKELENIVKKDNKSNNNLYTKGLEDIKKEDNILKKEKEKEKKEKEKETINTTAKLVVDFLNRETGKAFRYSESSLKHIRARLNEGFTLDDCKRVISTKVKEWKNTSMEKYLCPETLFCGKFEKYLNQDEGKNDIPAYMQKETTTYTKPSQQDVDEISELLKGRKMA